MQGKPIQAAATITWIAGAVSLVVAASLPLGYFGLSYQHQIGEIGTESQFNAKLASRYAHPGSETRLFQERNLIELLVEEDRTETPYPEQRRVLDANGRSLAISGDPLAPPVISQRAPVLADSKVVAYFEVSRSLRPLLADTGLAALLALALAGALFAALKLLPLRALNRALANLRQSEQLFSQAFHANPEPVMISRARDGRILNVNQSFTRLTGYASAEVLGRTYGELALWPDARHRGEGKAHAGPDGSCHNLALMLTTKHGEWRDVLLSSELTEIGDEICILAVARDITEQKRAEQRMAYLANYDQLTGLPNRALFRDRLAGAMHRAQRGERLVGLLYLDLDRFKQVNDSLGHPIGDVLLKQVAHRLQACVRCSDTVAQPSSGDEGDDMTIARLGGDEFTVIVEDIRHIDEITRVAQRILSGFTAPFDLADREVFIGASIGITVYPFDDTDPDSLIRNADVAMYRAKALGRNGFQFYTDDLNADAEQRLLLETDLRQALERGQFQLLYQPKLNLRTNLITGVEALLRWHSPHKGLVTPDEFIPLLEETGLIVPVGAWVLRTACEQAAAWASAGLNLTMAVNLSARQFHDDGLASTIQSALHDSGLPANQLELEVTESLLMEDSGRSQATLTDIKRMGVKISVDDFGTGYSSLAYLKRFPLDTLKIDRSFVKDVGADQEDTAIVRAIIALARNLRLTLVAEGVETVEQLGFLRDALCDQAQGYLISRPLDAATFEAWLAEQYQGQMV